MNTRASGAVANSSRYICASYRAHLARRRSDLASRVPQRRHIHLSTLRRVEEAKQLWKAKADAQIAGKEPTMLQILEERGYVNQIAGDRSKTEAIMRDERIGVYVGIDPTAPSMHVGHLVPFMALFWMYAHGYKAYTLLGGATALVGDPTGRTTSREELHNPTRKDNIVRMHLQLKKTWANVNNHLTKNMGYTFDVGSRRGLVNNNSWLNKLPVTDFLRMLGNHTRVGTMLGRDTARHKMEKGDGLSFSELAYPLLQGWDWWQLYKMLNVKMQIGGSDQMGNILAGKEAFAHCAREHQVHDQVADLSGATPIGFTVPLLTTASGAKFGKSAGNAVWIDPEMTSVYDQFQFFVRTADADVERYLKLLTFLPVERIAEIMEENSRDPGKRVAGNILAEQICLALHGQKETQMAKEQTAAVFGGKGINVLMGGLAEDSAPQPTGSGLKDQFINPSLNPKAPQTNAQSSFKTGITLPASRVKQGSYPALLMYTGLTASRSEGNRLIKSGGLYVASTAAGQRLRNEVSYSQIHQGADIANMQNFVIEGGNILILRVGKWKTKIITIVSDEEWAVGVAKGQMVIKDMEDKKLAPKDEEQTRLMMQQVEWAKLDSKIEAEEERYREDYAAKQARNQTLKRLKKATKEAVSMQDATSDEFRR